MTVTRYINGKSVTPEELSSYVLNIPQYLSAVESIRSRAGKKEDTPGKEESCRHEG